MKSKLAVLFGIMSVIAVAETNSINLEKTTVVSTTGFTESIAKENKNVTVITKEDLESKEYNNVSDVLREAANVTIQDTYFGPVVDLRGSGDRALSRVKVLVDGVAINPIDESMGTLPIDTIPVNSIEKIEVLPGSGAVLNGSGTAGGVVNIITKADARKDYVGVDFGYSSYNTKKTSVGVGYNVTDKLYVNAGYTYLDGRGYRHDEDKNHGSGTAGIDYKITDNQRIKFQATKYKGNETTSDLALKKAVEKDRKVAGFPIKAHSDREKYVLDYEIKPTEKLTILTTLYKERYNRNFDEKSIIDEYKINNRRMNFIGYTIPTTVGGTFDEKTKGVKIRGKYEYESGEAILGYDYAKTTLKRGSTIIPKDKFGMIRGTRIPTEADVDKTGTLTEINIDIINDVYKTTHGIYALDRHHINEDLDLITGIRWEHSKFGGDRDSDMGLTVYIPAGKRFPKGMVMPHPHLSQKSISKTKTSDDFAGELGLNYSYSDTGSVYTRYERGFISPLPGQITDKIGKTYTANDLKSEKSDNFEIGVRDFIGGNTYVSASTFATFTHDEISLTMSSIHNPANKWWKYDNLSETRRLGAEIVAEHYFDKLTLSEGLTYVDAKITKGEYKGDRVPTAPKGKLTLKAKYALTEKLSAGVTFNYVGNSVIREMDESSTPEKIKTFETKVGSHHFTDFGIEYKFNDNFAVKTGVNNVFNSKYNYQTTRDAVMPAPGRNYYAGVSVRF